MTLSRFYLATLGCKVNQYESHALREAWIARGCQEVSRPDAAQFILVNSCAVTAKAVADVRATVRRLNREAPGAAIFVTGCAAEVLQEELAALPGVAQVIKQSEKSVLTALFPLADARPDTLSPDEETHGPGKPEPHPVYPPFAVSGYDRSRAVLKIQDGCSHGCTYCIVPLTRGRARSRPYPDSLAEARRLLASGFREIVISGVNLRQYQEEASDATRHNFWDFLARLDADLAPDWAGKARLRISSLEPGQLTQEALEVLSACRLLAPHLHLSLQSGSISVLRRMGRGHYDPAAILNFLTSLQEIWPAFGLGADILTGFPGESADEFTETLNLCRELPLSYAHVFPYSRRPGTRAFAMRDQVPHAIKKERAAVLRNLVREKKKGFLESLLHMPFVHVIFEDRSSGQEEALQGVNEFYADCRLTDAQESSGFVTGTPVPVRPVKVVNGETLLVRGIPGGAACPC